MKMNKTYTKWFWLLFVCGFMLTHARDLTDVEKQSLKGLYIRASSAKNSIDVVRIIDGGIVLFRIKKQAKQFTIDLIDTGYQENYPNHQDIRFYATSGSNKNRMVVCVHHNEDISIHVKIGKDSATSYKEIQKLHKLNLNNIRPQDEESLRTQLEKSITTLLKSLEKEYNTENLPTTEIITYNSEFIQKHLQTITLEEDKKLSLKNLSTSDDDVNNDVYVYIYCCCFISILILTYVALKFIIKNPHHDVNKKQEFPSNDYTYDSNAPYDIV